MNRDLNHRAELRKIRTARKRNHAAALKQLQSTLRAELTPEERLLAVVADAVPPARCHDAGQELRRLLRRAKDLDVGSVVAYLPALVVTTRPPKHWDQGLTRRGPFGTRWW